MTGFILITDNTNLNFLTQTHKWSSSSGFVNQLLGLSIGGKDDATMGTTT